MADLFVKLPPEVISYIGDYADVASLRMLRLSSSTTREAFTPHFVQHVKDIQSIDLTQEGLDQLRDLSSSPDLGPRIRHLHLTCIYYHETPADPDRDTTFPDAPIFPYREQWMLHPLRLLDAPEDCEWMDHRQAEQLALTGAAMCAQLSDAFRAFGALDNITLEAAVVLGRQPEHRWPPHKVEYLAWRRLWARTIQAYRVVMSAIARSQIHLGSLAIYKETKICSVPYNEAVAVIPRTTQEDFAAVGSRLNEFSISLAATVASMVSIKDDDFYEPFEIPGGQDLSADGLEPENNLEFRDIARLFQLMPNLKSLTMHLYQTSRDAKSFFNSYSALLPALFRSTTLPHLRSLDLRGFPIQTTLMNDILSKSPGIQTIRLQYLYLDASEWRQALSPLVNANSAVRSLHLSDIWSFNLQEGYGTNVDWGVAVNLMAANPERIHSSVPGEPKAGELGLWIEIPPGSSSALSGGMASYRDWVEVANRILECGPPSNWSPSAPPTVDILSITNT
ncbi:hypothetical protein AK830_g4173 [Neonectria ditissima]|uniref:Uncharacterized protein n=1 Tax=Neonectria ditissima TaxID=78410 RepID=A0A0P7BNM1_9HYPO|nr:hypothetical protein AK830_g4173 [Neonectria ditissima]